MAENRRCYPVGIQTFENVREGNYLYVDKTPYIVDFRKKQMRYVFLSRPRRFGKSLFVSTLKSYFEGKKELFEGLAIADYEREWVKHPVLHFSMAGGKHMEKEQLERYLSDILNEQEAVFGYKSEKKDANLRLIELVRRAYEQTGQKVVVLIDEYDAPLLDVVHEETQMPVLRNVMRNFYSPLKQLDPYLEFTFLTGITKFSQLSIFSELNNLDNISMYDQYSAICGISKTELTTAMQPDVERLGQALGLTYEECLQRLTDYYDGYHFSKKSEDVFNPFSLIKAMNAQDIAPYWFGSGTPTYLINMMRKFGVKPSQLGKTKAKAASFDAATETLSSLTPLLYQSGYFTIKDYDPRQDLYTLDLPNREITVGLFDSLLPGYLERSTDEGRVVMAELSACLNDGDIDGALQLMADFLETVPYCDNTHYEGHWQQTLYIMFALLTDYNIQVEQHTAKGRIDITLETQTTVYVMELKINGSVEDALAQIESRHYADAFQLKDKPVVKVGLNFSLKDGINTLEWQVK